MCSKKEFWGFDSLKIISRPLLIPASIRRVLKLISQPHNLVVNNHSDRTWSNILNFDRTRRVQIHLQDRLTVTKISNKAQINQCRNFILLELFASEKDLGKPRKLRGIKTSNLSWKYIENMVTIKGIWHELIRSRNPKISTAEQQSCSHEWLLIKGAELI